MIDLSELFGEKKLEVRSVEILALRKGEMKDEKKVSKQVWLVSVVPIGGISIDKSFETESEAVSFYEKVREKING